MGLLLGIDGGATKTVLALKNADNEVIVQSAPGTNHEVIGFEKVFSILNNGIEKLLEKTGNTWKNISSACLGMAGIDFDIDSENFKARVFKRLPLECRILLKNDAYIAFKAGTSAINGILLNAGSGVKALGISGDYELYSNAVGINSLQHRIVDTMGREQELQEKDASLSEAMADLLNIDNIHDYLQWLYLYNESRKKACPYSETQMLGYPKAFFELLRQGHQKAEVIFDILIKDYSRLALILAKKLKFRKKNYDLVLSGSIFSRNRDLDLESVFFKAFRDYGRDMVPERITVLNKPPYWGALLEAERMLGSL